MSDLDCLIFAAASVVATLGLIVLIELVNLWTEGSR